MSHELPKANHRIRGAQSGRVLTRLAATLKRSGVETRALVVHADTGKRAAPMSLCPGVQAVGWQALHALLEDGG